MTARDILDLAWIIPLLPAVGAVLLLPFGKRIGEPIAGWIATTLVSLAFVWSVITFFALRSLPANARVNVSDGFTWIQAGTFRVDFRFLTDPLSVTMILFVTGVAALIHVYSIGYMHGDPRFSRFFAYLNLFVASMLVLVLGSSFLVTFMGWEGVGLCSYLLVSFWFERNSAARRRQEGIHHQPHRRLRVHARHVPDLREGGITRLRRRQRCRAAPVADGGHRDRAPALRGLRSARARSSRCTSGCPTRWKAPPPSRRSSTRPRW